VIPNNEVLLMWCPDRRIWFLAALLASTIIGARQVRGQSSSLPVVPGAFGFGMSTRAAYGCGANPVVLRVTSLADSGTGTLRAAMDATSPRVVIFEVSGNIDLQSGITLNNPCITVAGQTAPSPGITVRYYGLEVRTHDVLLQHFRIRPGWTGSNCNEGLGTYPTASASNVVLDHMSVSWGLDENIYVYPGIGGGDANFTFWRSITSENLNYTPGSASCTGNAEAGHGFLVTQQTTHVAIIQSLTAHNNQRNPYIQNGSTIVILNNVIYNWYKEWGIVFGSHSTLPGGAWAGTAIGNRFKRGLDTVNPGDGNQAWMFYYLLDSGYSQAGNKIYRSDNTLDDGTGSLSGRITTEANELPYDPNVSSVPAQAPLPAGYAAMASTATEAFVVANAGARPTDRDAVDTRLMSDVVNRTGHVIATQGAVGGWPALAVNTRALALPSNPQAVQPSGYTALEEWLHSYAAGVEGGASQTAPAAPTGLRILTS
jgi:hypothetical protein